MFRVLGRYLKPYWQSVLLVMILQLAQTLCTLYLPNMNAHIINQGVVRGDIPYIWREGLMMIVISLVQIVLSIVATYFGAKTAFSMARDIRKVIFHKVEEFSVREIGQFGPATLITRITNDVQQVQMVTFFLMTLIVTCPFMFIGGVAMSLEQDVPLSGVIAVTLPVVMIVAFFFVKKMMPFFQKFQKKIDRMNEILREQITGVRVVHAFTREESERKRFMKANVDLYGLNVSTGRLMTLMFPVFMFIINLSVLAIMWFGGLRVDSGEMEIGAITAFITYMMYIMMAVLMSSMIFVMWPRAEVAAKRLREVYKTKSSVKEPKEPVHLNPAEVKGEIKFEGVKFRYAGAQESVIRDISFTAEPGQTTAIIGSTGCGKSTLMNLIPRLYDATDGVITIDGVNIKKLPLSELGAMISVIPQKSYLFSGTLADNLRFGKEDATEEEMWEALEIAQAADFVKEKASEIAGSAQHTPDDAGSALHTPEPAPAPPAPVNPLEVQVAQGGTNFSGGQRQRLAIARAVIRKPKVFLFDDSFSALDYATDQKLRAALAPLVKNATMMVIAQRVSTIRHAEQIIVMDNGKIVGIGTHEQLLESCETYQEIVNSQLSAEEALK